MNCVIAFTVVVVAVLGCSTAVCHHKGNDDSFEFDDEDNNKAAPEKRWNPFQSLKLCRNRVFHLQGELKNCRDECAKDSNVEGVMKSAKAQMARYRNDMESAQVLTNSFRDNQYITCPTDSPSVSCVETCSGVILLAVIGCMENTKCCVSVVQT